MTNSCFYCPNCGSENPEFNVSCRTCGHELPQFSSARANRARNRGEQPTLENINGRFEVVSLLGKGGMGLVYKAYDQLLAREVAVKILPVEGDQSLSEARAASALNHPCIVTVYDLLVAGANGYLVMELIEGETLADLLKLGRLAPDRVVALGIQIASALEAAHGAGIVHRDIKPGNIMLGSDGKAKVLDFGLAARWRHAPTKGVARVGTPAYMSPEQILGKPVDARSDLFSLGVLLYELAGGRHPFQPRPPENVAHAILHRGPEPLAIDDPILGKPLQELLKLLLVKDPEKRMQSAAAARNELEGLQGRSASQAGMLSAAPPPSEPFKGAKRRLALAFAILAATFLVWRYGPFKSVPPSDFPTAGPESAASHKRGLAVLPLRMIGAEEGDAALRDGILETLTGQLSRLEESDQSLSVVPTSLVRDLDITSAGAAKETLGVALALEGSIQRLPGEFRVMLHLVDVRSNAILISKRVDGSTDNLADLQNRIAEAALRMTDPDLPMEVVSKEGRAYEYILRGKGHFSARQTPAHREQAIDAFEKAVTVDPHSPAAHALLAQALVFRYQLHAQPEDLETASRHAEKALALNDQLAEAWLAAGLVSKEKGALETASDQLEEAARLNPLATNALVELGILHQYRKQWDRAENAYQRAISLRQTAWRPRYNLAILYFRLGRFEEAEAVLLEAIRIAPGEYLNYQTLGGVYYMLGKRNLALDNYQKALELKTTSAVLSNIGTIAYFEGQFERAADAFRAAVGRWPENYIYWGNLGDSSRFLADGAAESAKAYAHALRLLRAKRESDPANINWRIHEALYLSRRGNLDDARSLLSEDMESSEVQELYNLAVIHELLGQRQRALAQLDRAFSLGLDRYEVERESDLKALCRSPEYAAMILIGGKNDRKESVAD